MKAMLSVVALVATAAASLAIAATAEDAQEQMKKCAVCKFLAEAPDLMATMTWECHKVDAGMLCLATVPKEKKKQYDEIHKKMMATVEKIKSDAAAGRDIELCSFCTSMGELEKAGAKEETVDTATGSVYLVTSADPAVVAKIHAQADKAIAEQEAMQQDRPL